MRQSVTALAVILFSSACLTPASAQLLPEDRVITVKDRLSYDPEYQPLGVRSGSLLFFPQINTQLEYDDNIFRTKNQRQDDFLLTVTPELEVQTDWNLHAITFNLDTEAGFYADNTNENYVDINTMLSGRYDITYNTYLSGDVYFRRLHEERGSPDDRNGDEPTEYNILGTKLSFTRALARLKLYTAAMIEQLDFQDTQRNAITIDNDIRDRVQSQLLARLSYEVKPNYDLYFQSSVKDVSYDETSTVDRSSTGYDLRIGTDFKVTGKMKADVYAGYINRNFSAPFKDLNEFNFGASGLWNITPLTSIKFGADRSVFETTSTSGPQFSGYFKTRGSLALEHALRENIVAELHGRFERDDFIGGGSNNREDDTLTTGLNFTYMPNRSIEFIAGYDYKDRSSDTATANYTNNTVRLSLTYRF